MKRSLFILLLVFSTSLIAQENLSDRLFFGGGFGFSTGSNQTNLSLSPQVGYKVTEQFMSGVGVMYQYVKIKNPDFSFNHYGWSVFSRYTVYQNFFAYGEFERLSFEYLVGANEDTDRKGYNSLLLGGGYFERLGGRASFSFMALYNVLYDANELPRPYNSPLVIRAGIGIGI